MRSAVDPQNKLQLTEEEKNEEKIFNNYRESGERSE